MNREDELLKIIETANAELLKIIETANAELWQIRNDREDKEAKRWVGTYWKFKNSYCSDSSWWMYIYVTNTKEGVCYGNTFQTDDVGQIKVCIGDYVSSVIEDSEQITEHEFLDALNGIRCEMNNFLMGYN